MTAARRTTVAALVALAAACGGQSTARQKVTHQVTVTRAGSGSGTVTSTPAGLSCGAGCSADLDEGTTVTLTATPDGDSQFDGFSGDCAGATCTLTVDRARSVTANFVRLRTLTVTASGNGDGTIASSGTPTIACTVTAGAASGTCSVRLPQGTPVTLTPTAGSHARFDAWSGDCSGATCAMTMDADRTVSAAFVPRIEVSVTFAGSGGGTVSFGDGNVCDGTCVVTFDAGAALTIAGTAGAGSRFAGFSGDYVGAGPDAVAALGGPLSLTATFVQQIDVSVTFAGAGSGTVSFGGAATPCTSSCTRTFDAGSTVSVEGVAAAGDNRFMGFGGDCSGAACLFLLSWPNKSLTATFAPAYPIGGTLAGLSGSGLVLGNSVDGGAAEQLSVAANGAFVFPTKVPAGSTWSVSVVTQPGAPAQTCTVAAGTGSGTASADVTSVQIDCPPFVVAGGLDGPGLLRLNGSTLYFGVSLYPGVTNCYTTNPGAGDRIMRVAAAGGTPTMVDWLDNAGGNCGLYGVVFDSTYVYWTNYPTGRIVKAPLAGGSPTTVGTVQGYNNALVLGGGYLYHHSYPNTWLGRVSVGGTGNTQFVNTPTDYNGQTLAIDATNLYWTDYNTGRVDTIRLDAASLPASPTNLASGEGSPLAPFVTASALYWVQTGAAGALRWVSLPTPGTPASLNSSPLADPVEAVVDAGFAWVAARGSGPGDGRIYRIPVGGGAPVVVARGLHQPTSITQDANHVYWTDNNTSGATRNSDGTICMIVK